MIELLLDDVVTLIIYNIGWLVVFHANSWDDNLGYKVNWPKYVVLSYDVVLNCDVMIIIALVSCWLLTNDDVYPKLGWIEGLWYKLWSRLGKCYDFYH